MYFTTCPAGGAVVPGNGLYVIAAIEAIFLFTFLLLESCSLFHFECSGITCGQAAASEWANALTLGALTAQA